MSVLAVLLAIGVLVWLQGLLYRLNWNKNISLSLSFSEKHATEGESLILTEVITNRKLLPLPWLAVKFQASRNLMFKDLDNAKVSDDYYRNDLFNLPPFRRVTRRLPFVCSRRGFYTVKSAELISGDILASQKLAMSVPCRATLTVYPRVIDIDAFLIPHKQFLGQLLTKRFIQPDPFEFRGIREYQPYDSLRSVNFKASAKTGDWMVNVNDYTISQEIVLLLNLQKYNAFPSETLYEQTIRLAASLAAWYMDQAIPLSFVSNARGADSLFDENRKENTTDGGIWLDSGSGSGHLSNINEALARIDLRLEAIQLGSALLDTLHHSQEMKRRAGHEPAYILISTYHEKDFYDAYMALQESGADVLWIIPVLKGMEVSVPLSEQIVSVEMG